MNLILGANRLVEMMEEAEGEPATVVILSVEDLAAVAGCSIERAREIWDREARGGILVLGKE